MAPLRMRYFKVLSEGTFRRRLEWSGQPTHPLVSKLAVAVVGGPLDWEGHCAENEGPLDTDLVHDGTTQETDWYNSPLVHWKSLLKAEIHTDRKHGICDCGADI